jgi:hypothetical protein
MCKVIIFTCLLILFQTVAVGLFAQTEPDSTVVPDIIVEQTEMIFYKLYDADVSAADYIYWEDFYVNDEDITLLYYDAVDGGYEDEFYGSTITRLSGDLHYKEAAVDPFIEWTYTVSEFDVYVTCHNSATDVQMWLTVPDTEQMYLVELIYSDR